MVLKRRYESERRISKTWNVVHARANPVERTNNSERHSIDGSLSVNDTLNKLLCASIRPSLLADRTEDHQSLVFTKHVVIRVATPLGSRWEVTCESTSIYLH